MSYVKVLDGRNIIAFAVDKWVFERDIDRGFLGESVAGTLIFPYKSLIDANYLRTQEVKLKKRLILELMENIVLSFPELSYRIHIKPEYFMYEAMLNRVRVFPPLAYGKSNFMKSNPTNKAVTTVLNGYIEALRQLEKEGKIVYSNNYITLSKKFVDESKNPRTRVINISKNAPRTLFTSFFEAFPQFLNFFTQNAELLRTQKFALTLKRESDNTPYFVDPQKYLFVPTKQGLIPLADRVTIKAFARKILLRGKDVGAEVKIEAIGGVLNDVYLIRTYPDGVETKALVKRYKDWSNFKWFPLTLWSLGARTFAVLARSRLERECAINELLANEGFNVPEILYMSTADRLIFMEYIEGENLSNAIKRIAAAKNNRGLDTDIILLEKTGETLAKVHAIDVALGDTKPENFRINTKGEIYLLDLEQASRKGDKTWDVAEFLYYSGHYLPPLNSNNKIELVTRAFINGYLKAGGDANVIQKAAASKYARVFSVLTPLNITLTISNICKKIKTLEQKP